VLALGMGVVRRAWVAGVAGGVLVGDGSWCDAAWWARRGAARGLCWLASMLLGWWGVCGSAARALWSGACGGLVRVGVPSKIPDYLSHAPWERTRLLQLGPMLVSVRGDM